ncbi:MAG: bifunctional DNA-formamidopyrimidine glycosylase/DNA-(apurinic or apyrimidinic site) lyase [Acidobacteria bacterium]|nr:bifunctional DNA-formamidopyrimidine glycosylase/DNA-(apurinic or apyrimidinic site) lyase [Acidobacteriota bacterium]
MPELPEVETVRRSLHEAVVGARVARVDIGRLRSVRRTGPDVVRAGLLGESFVDTRRRGKYLFFDLANGNSMMVHLRMSGRLLLARPDAPLEPHTHVTLHLEQPGGDVIDLRFVDPRTFGEVVVFNPDDDLVPEVHRLGIDPLVDDFSYDAFRTAVAGRRRGLKAVLLDQAIIAGIGNIYADEIMHRARLRWDRRVDTLRAAQLKVLHRTTLEVLHEAVEAGGSTLSDTQYVDALGREGIFQTEHRVYAREGERCVTCRRGVIRRVAGAGRSTHFCPVCQR